MCLRLSCKMEQNLEIFNDSLINYNIIAQNASVWGKMCEKILHLIFSPSFKNDSFETDNMRKDKPE